MVIIHHAHPTGHMSSLGRRILATQLRARWPHRPLNAEGDHSRSDQERDDQRQRLAEIAEEVQRLVEESRHFVRYGQSAGSLPNWYVALSSAHHISVKTSNCLGETGVVWALTPDDLSVHSIATETDGIEQAERFEDSFILTTSNGHVRRMRHSETATTSEPLEIRSSLPFCHRGSLFLFVQDDGIVGYDATDDSVVLNEPLRLSAIDVNEDGELVGVDERRSLCFYKFSDSM